MLFHLAFARIDRERRSVECSILGTGLFREKAVHVDGIGAVLLTGIPEETVRAWPRVRAAAAASPESLADPLASRRSDRSFDPRLRHRSARRSKPRSAGSSTTAVGGNPLRTRAVLVVHDGKLVCERYAPGFGPDTRMLSWSMAKSVVSVLVGILAGQGRIRIDEPGSGARVGRPARPAARHHPEPAPAHELGPRLDRDLRGAADRRRQPHAVPRARHGPLRRRPAAGDGARHDVPLLLGQHEHPLPDHARPVREREEYLAFPHRALFDRIGIRGAAWGTDASGTIVGSSYLFATARDFARFGMFCLADGVWQGERILPEGWMRWATTPTPTDPSAEYGAGFWLNRDPTDTGRRRAYPKLPTDFYYANGHQGQMIGVIPSRKLVVVRLGMTWGSEWGREEFLAEVLELRRRPPGTIPSRLSSRRTT